MTELTPEEEEHPAWRRLAAAASATVDPAAAAAAANTDVADDAMTPQDTTSDGLYDGLGISLDDDEATVLADDDDVEGERELFLIDSSPRTLAPARAAAAVSAPAGEDRGARLEAEDYIRL